MTDTKEAIKTRLLACCGSRRWAEAMADLWPFASQPAVAEEAARVWRGLAREDWLEAFAAHPKIGDSGIGDVQIGDTGASGTAASEQAGVRTASPQELEELARLNLEYEARFGYIYIVCASGRSAREMLEILRRRLLNGPREELAIAVEEQLAITQIRLKKLL